MRWKPIKAPGGPGNTWHVGFEDPKTRETTLSPTAPAFKTQQGAQRAADKRNKRIFG